MSSDTEFLLSKVIALLTERNEQDADTKRLELRTKIITAAHERYPNHDDVEQIADSMWEWVLDEDTECSGCDECEYEEKN
jgi:hypothetical protein